MPTPSFPYGERASTRRRYRRRYLELQDLLDSLATPLQPWDFYRLLFPPGSFERRRPELDGLDREERATFYRGLPVSERRPNGLIIEPPRPGEDSRPKVYTLFDDLAGLEDFYGTQRFGLLAPIGYSGHKRSLDHAYTLYAMAFDVDRPNVENILYQASHHIIPCPTFIVLSGHGVHLYYQFEQPIPMYPSNRQTLNRLKHHLTRHIWTHYTSSIEKPQYQGINQGFRIVGEASKLGTDRPVRAWMFGPPVTTDYLIDFLDDEEKADMGRVIEGEGRVSLAEAKENWPDWYHRRVEKREVAKSWHIKRDLYDWWLRKIQTESSVGHRYFCVMALAVYARKCDVPLKELEHDAYGLIPLLDSVSPESNPFTRDDVKAALKAYDDKYATFTRDAISSLTAIRMTPNRRNYRKQAEHLKRARAVQEIDDPDGAWRKGAGRPKGAVEEKRRLVLEYATAHPQAGPTEISHATGVSRSSVYKYLPAHRSTPRGTAGGRPSKRAVVMDYLDRNGGMPADELAAGCGVSRPTAEKYLKEWKERDPWAALPTFQ